MEGVFVVVGALALAGTAHAGLMDFGTIANVSDAFGGETTTGSPGGLYLEGTGAQLRGTNTGGINSFLLSGVFDFEIDFLNGNGFEPLLTYCIEPEQAINVGTAPDGERGGAMTYQIIPLSLAEGFTPQEVLFTEILWANAFETSTTGRAEAGAFQSILWEFTQDDSFDLLSGNTRLNIADNLTGQAADIAEQWFENISTGVWTRRTPMLALTSPLSQDLLLPIPSPGALSLMGMGGLLAARRRRA